MKGRKVFSFSLVCPRRVLLFWYILYWQLIFAPSLSLLDPIHPIAPLLFPFPFIYLPPFPPSCQLFLHCLIIFNQSCLYPNASTHSFIYPNWSLISSFHLNIPSSQDPTAMSSPSGVDHAVIGGVVAVIVFILLCLLIIFGRYLIRHKGQLLAL